MSTSLIIALLLIAVAGGGLIGFLLGSNRGGNDAKRADALQEEFDDYRRNVTEHFGETAEHFRKLGRQYRSLYEHMASGADQLIDTDARARLAFPSLVAIDAVAESADGDDGASAASGDDAGAPDGVPASATAEAADAPARPNVEARVADSDDATTRAANDDGDAQATDAGDTVDAEGETRIDEHRDAAATADGEDSDDETRLEGDSEATATADDAAGDDEPAEPSDRDQRDPDTLRRAGAT